MPASPAARSNDDSAGPLPGAREQLWQRLREYRAIGPGGETRRQRTARLVLTAALEQLDLEGFDRLHETCRRDAAEGRRWLGYFDLAGHLVRVAGVGVKFGLDRRPPTRILDLGCGGGHFGFLCRAVFGHEVVGLELPAEERPINHAVCRLMGLPLIEARLGPRRPLPPEALAAGPFELVTVVSPQFHRVDVHRFWSVGEWAWFLDHLAREVTGPEGGCYLKVNREKRVKGGLYRHDDLFAFARAQGARIEEKASVIRFERLGATAASA